MSDRSNPTTLMLLRDLLKAKEDCVFGEPAWHDREAELWARVGDTVSMSNQTTEPCCNMPELGMGGQCADCHVAEVADQNLTTKLRREQSRRVMPLIGGLIDAWDHLPNDEKSYIRDMYPALEGHMTAIRNAVEGNTDV